MKITHLFPILFSVSLGVTLLSTQRMLPFLGGVQDWLSDMRSNTAFALSLYKLSESLDDSYDNMMHLLFGDSVDQFLDQLNLCYSDNTVSFLQTEQNVLDIIEDIYEERNEVSLEDFCLGDDFGRRAIPIILQELLEDVLGCDEFEDGYTSIIESYLNENGLGVNVDDEGFNPELDENIIALRDNLDDALSQFCSSLILITD